MKAFHGRIRVSTGGDDDVVDLTADLQALVRESGVSTGMASALVVGSTAALTTLEFEPGLARHDLAACLERLAPRDARYHHEATWGDDNGHSHVRAALLGATLALPVVEGRVPFGTWQQAVLVDLDTRPRDRIVEVTVVGD